jgi:opacity protein-like surface antigen
MTITRQLGGAALLLLFGAAPAAAQAWDSPSFFAPRPGEDLGIFVTVPEEDAGDIGVQGIWRQEGNINLGVRGGIGGVEGNRSVLLGAEFFGGLPVASLPVNASWIVGFGAGFDDDVTMLRVPLGISVGTFLGEGSGFRVQPYVHPRVAFDLIAIGEGDDEETETDFSFAIDIGADVDLSERFAVKAGYTFAFGPDFDTPVDFYPNTFGAGIVYRMPRRVASN